MTLLQAARVTRLLGVQGAIRHHLGRIHVMTPDSKVRADLTRAARKGKATGPDAIRLGVEVYTAAVVAYGLAVHRHNRREYLAVVGGR